MPVLTGIGEQLKDKAGTAKSKTATINSELNITADESTNPLVITAQPNVMNSLEKAFDVSWIFVASAGAGGSHWLAGAGR